MNPSLKRKIIPMFDWEAFLQEGKKELNYLLELKRSRKYGRNNFDFIKILGQGGFGRVYKAKMKETEDFYAVKVLDKKKVVQNKQIRHALNEKKILQALNFPFCVYLEHAFQDNSYLYLCLPLINGGEMFTHLRKLGRFNEPLAKFYGAQVLLAFEYLHYNDMIYRDLKPENILIDSKGYLKITDFGFCKVVKGRTYSLCGTPDYLAPEIILQRAYGKSVDWWTYGILLYEMNAGFTPFYAKHDIKKYEKVVKGAYGVPRSFSPDLSHLIRNILQVDLTKRFGVLKNGIHDIKYHPWYKEMNWYLLFNGRIEPPYVPKFSGSDDASTFRRYKEVPMKVESTDIYARLFLDF